MDNNLQGVHRDIKRIKQSYNILYILLKVMHSLEIDRLKKKNTKGST